MKNKVFTIIGGISLALGIVGIFFPVLPTTPFLLLTAACWMKGSGRLYNWLMGHPVFGKYIEDFMSHRSIPRSTKIVTLVLLWLTMSASALFFVESWWVRALLGVVAVGVTIHILSFKTS